MSFPRRAWESAWTRGTATAEASEASPIVPAHLRPPLAAVLLAGSAWLSWIVPIDSFGDDPLWVPAFDLSLGVVSSRAPSIPTLGHLLVALAALSAAGTFSAGAARYLPPAGLVTLGMAGVVAVLGFWLLPLIVFSPGLLCALAGGFLLLGAGAPDGPSPDQG